MQAACKRNPKLEEGMMYALNSGCFRHACADADAIISGIEPPIEFHIVDTVFFYHIHEIIHGPV